jgi:hypothetical protein
MSSSWMLGSGCDAAKVASSADTDRKTVASASFGVRK